VGILELFKKEARRGEKRMADEVVILLSSIESYRREGTLSLNEQALESGLFRRRGQSSWSPTKLCFYVFRDLENFGFSNRGGKRFVLETN
jgi:hypothetical protein